MGGQSSKVQKTSKPSISQENIQAMNDLKQLSRVKKELNNKRIRTTNRKVNAQNSLKQISEIEKQLNQLEKITQTRINFINQQRSANLLQSQVKS